MRWVGLWAVFCGCTAPEHFLAENVTRTGAGDDPWSALAVHDLPGAASATFDPVALDLVVGTSDGLARMTLAGAVTPLVSTGTIVGIATDGDAVWLSDDDAGVVYRYDAAGLVPWASTFHDGDDDPTGIALIPQEWTGPTIVRPGEAVVVDRGVAGPDEVWSLSLSVPEAELQLFADDGTLRDAVAVAASPDDLAIADTRAASNGQILHLGGTGLAVLATGLLDPTGIAWDPVREEWLVMDAGTDSIVAVGTNGSVTTCFAGVPETSETRYANLSVSPAGHLMAVTTDDAVALYGRCDPTPFDDALDCDDSGTTDVCELALGLLEDCDADGTPDSCQRAGPGALDCDCDGMFDGCDATCPDGDDDGIGDACDACTDPDGDGYGQPGDRLCAEVEPDLCPYVPDTPVDTDGDGVGDACDPCLDFDHDGYGEPGSDLTGCAGPLPDGCPTIPDDQTDFDGDGIGNVCDPCTDRDGDGFGDPSLPRGTCPFDCDDTSAAVYPGAPESPYDGIDQDCNGVDRCDVDGDGADAIACGGKDCNDADASIYPGALEVPDDGVDQDCDPDNDVGCGCRSVDGSGGVAAGLVVLMVVGRRRRRSGQRRHRASER